MWNSVIDFVSMFLFAVCLFDVFQWVCIPFCIHSEHVGPLTYPTNDWIGTVDSKYFGQWIDCGLLLMLGGIPWQVYFQRVLSCRSAFKAQVLSYVAAVGCIVMAVPAMIMGAVAKATNWNETALERPLKESESALVLPLVLQYLTPSFVSCLGLGAVSAAVMSSSDSSILSAASMFARNVYKLIFRQNVSTLPLDGQRRFMNLPSFNIGYFEPNCNFDLATTLDK